MHLSLSGKDLKMSPWDTSCAQGAAGSCEKCCFSSPFPRTAVWGKHPALQPAQPQGRRGGEGQGLSGGWSLGGNWHPPRCAGEGGAGGIGEAPRAGVRWVCRSPAAVFPVGAEGTGVKPRGDADGASESSRPELQLGDRARGRVGHGDRLTRSRCSGCGAAGNPSSGLTRRAATFPK